MPKHPHIFVAVADGASRHVILARAEEAFRKAKLDKERREFQLYLPSGYAATVAHIRGWFDTD